MKWLIGYKDILWKTIELPEDMEHKVVDLLLKELNKRHEIVYVRVEKGIAEKDNHKKKIGEFLGI
jgi:hypothetical protein